MSGCFLLDVAHRGAQVVEPSIRLLANDDTGNIVLAKLVHNLLAKLGQPVSLELPLLLGGAIFDSHVASDVTAYFLALAPL